MSAQPKSASDFGKFDDPILDDYLDENLVLLHLEYVTTKKDGSPMPFGPTYILTIAVENTNETADVWAKGSKVKRFCDAVYEAGEFPVRFRVSQPKKAYEVGDWQ